MTTERKDSKIFVVVNNSDNLQNDIFVMVALLGSETTTSSVFGSLADSNSPSVSPSFELPASTSNRGVLVVDTEDRIAFADSNIFHLLGVSSVDLIGKQTVGAVGEVLKRRFADGDDYEARWQFVREHPEEILDDVLHLEGPEGRVIHRYSAPIFGKAGECVGRVEIYSDITRRRELEAAVRHAYDELQATQDQLIQSEKLRAVGEIASGVAHDFNNTLGIILGNLQLLLRNSEDPATVLRLQSAERAALDAVDTVRRIQEFTKTRPQEPPSVLELSELAAEVVEMMKPVWQDGARAQGRTVEIQLDLAKACALGNAPELREVLTNILLNAVQAMPDGGSICISTGCSNGSSWVEVEDTGIGMSEDVKNRVFDPFFTTRGVEGTGLGMSVAYGIIKRHGGKISVESEVGKGTVITILLPAATKTDQVAAENVEASAISVTPAKILVVDDEEMFAAVLVEMLSECGHAVCVARSGSEAVEQFRETPFDLVFTDLGMPEMSGWQVAKKIKDLEPQVPVVLLTGWGAAIDKAELDASAVDMVLAKPVKMEDLSTAVAEMQSSKCKVKSVK